MLGESHPYKQDLLRFANQLRRWHEQPRWSEARLFSYEKQVFTTFFLVRRFTVEETFRDVKNPRFGLGLKQTIVSRKDRRDALFLLAVLGHPLLTLLGKAGQELGMERMLGATRPAQLSLFRQGLMLYELLPRMREDRLRALMRRFGELLRHHVLFTGILGVV
jgi:hypothetical protein